MPYLHFIAVVLIMMLYICEVCLCNDSLGNYYEMKVDSTPTGTPYSSFSSRTRMKCATVCNSDVECSTVTSKENDHGVECELYTCGEAWLTTRQNDTTTFTKEGYDSCPSDYKCGPNDHCYHYNATHMTWDDASNYCNSTHPGAYMVEVNSSEENYFIRIMTDDFTWLGGRLLSGNWTWAHSGRILSDGYENWLYGLSAGWGDCIGMDYSSGQWYDWPCNKPGAILCEYGN